MDSLLGVSADRFVVVDCTHQQGGKREENKKIGNEVVKKRFVKLLVATGKLVGRLESETQNHADSSEVERN